MNISLLIPSSPFTFDFIFEVFDFFLIIRESSLHTDKFIAYRLWFFITSALNSLGINLFNCSINVCLKIHQTRHCNLNHTFWFPNFSFVWNWRIYFSNTLRFFFKIRLVNFTFNGCLLNRAILVNFSFWS